MNRVKIKLLSQFDWHLWKKIRLEALKKNPEAFGSSFEEETLRSDSDWESSLISSDVFGAFSQNSLIGTAGFFTYSQTKQKHKGGLFGVYVLPEFRNKKTADQLISAVLEHAKNKVTQIHCTVVTQNTIAIRLYEKHGFVSYGIEPMALKIGNEFVDEILMIKKF